MARRIMLYRGMVEYWMAHSGIDIIIYQCSVNMMHLVLLDWLIGPCYVLLFVFALVTPCGSRSGSGLRGIAWSWRAPR